MVSSLARGIFTLVLESFHYDPHCPEQLPVKGHSAMIHICLDMTCLLYFSLSELEIVFQNGSLSARGLFSLAQSLRSLEENGESLLPPNLSSRV